MLSPMRNILSVIAFWAAIWVYTILNDIETLDDTNAILFGMSMVLVLSSRD